MCSGKLSLLPPVGWEFTQCELWDKSLVQLTRAVVCQIAAVMVKSSISAAMYGQSDASS